MKDKNPYNPLNWRKSFLLLILGGFLLLWFLFLDTYSIYTRYELSSRKSELIEKTKALKKENARLEKKVNTMKSDSMLIERIAREQYGMRKPGETVYKIDKNNGKKSEEE